MIGDEKQGQLWLTRARQARERDRERAQERQRQRQRQSDRDDNLDNPDNPDNATNEPPVKKPRWAELAQTATAVTGLLTSSPTPTPTPTSTHTGSATTVSSTLSLSSPTDVTTLLPALETVDSSSSSSSSAGLSYPSYERFTHTTPSNNPLSNPSESTPVSTSSLITASGDSASNPPTRGLNDTLRSVTDIITRHHGGGDPGQHASRAQVISNNTYTDSSIAACQNQVHGQSRSGSVHVITKELSLNQHLDKDQAALSFLSSLTEPDATGSEPRAEREEGKQSWTPFPNYKNKPHKITDL